jgi:hypothetical protein
MTFSPRFLLTTFYPIRFSDFVSSIVVVPYYPPPLSLFTGVSELHAFGAEARKQVTMISFKWEPNSIRLTISRIIGTTPFHSAWDFPPSYTRISEHGNPVCAGAFRRDPRTSTSIQPKGRYTALSRIPCFVINHGDSGRVNGARPLAS